VNGEFSALRVSVRALVGFSVFPADIQPVSKRLMELGRVGHLARQGQSQARAEAALSWEGEAEGLLLRLSGRMDLFDAEADPPLIEEIKLSPDLTPAEPLPEHLLQAVCYGFMLATRDGLYEVRLRVCYVTLQGDITAAFEETRTLEELRAAFYALLLPWAAWQNELLAHSLERDRGLVSLPFPYAAFRPGQREMAAQAYTAIQRRKRLFALMPTGTGKTAAVLYPALKALAQGLNRQVFCLTARGTQRYAVLKELDTLRGMGLRLHALTLNAKEKFCPMEHMRCHPGHCERARGHFTRQPAALLEALPKSNWDTDLVLDLALRHSLCPFEFSLALCEIADLVICDYNYALDPQVRLQRIFDSPRGVTLLIDEAHNLPDRARDMLSGYLDAAALTRLRREAGKTSGRKGGLYRAFSALLGVLAQEILPEDGERLLKNVYALLDELGRDFSPGGAELARDLIAFQSAWHRAEEEREDYTLLHNPQKGRGGLRVLCLNPAPWLKEATRRMAGCVFFSATLQPLEAMRGLLGGEASDACLALPSPFPPENLLTLLLPLNTRYRSRGESLLPAAEAILALYTSQPGKYIAYFPSFAYLGAVREALADFSPEVPLITQEPGMSEGERADFLARFTGDDAPLLGLCVLGGVFAEGVDLPGRALIGAMVLGVGLPQVNAERDLYRERMQQTLGEGFGYAYRYPGMHKVLQAAGRLIRSESDRGVLLLMDDRYGQKDYSALLPPHWRLKRVYSREEITLRARDFWEGGGETHG
jgi:DNA excision repair protein ERCC-2